MFTGCGKYAEELFDRFGNGPTEYGWMVVDMWLWIPRMHPHYHTQFTTQHFTKPQLGGFVISDMVETRGNSRRHLRSGGSTPGLTLSQVAKQNVKKARTLSNRPARTRKLTKIQEDVEEEPVEEAETVPQAAGQDEHDKSSNLEYEVDDQIVAPVTKVVHTSDSISGSEPPRRPPSIRRPGEPGASHPFKFNVPSVVIEKIVIRKRTSHQNPAQSEVETGPPRPVGRIRRLHTIEEEAEEDGPVPEEEEDKEEGQEELERLEAHRSPTLDDMDVDHEFEDANSGSDYSETERNGKPGQGKRKSAAEEDEEEEEDELELEVVPESPQHMKGGTRRRQVSAKGKEVQKKIPTPNVRAKPARENDHTSKMKEKGKAKQPVRGDVHERIGERRNEDDDVEEDNGDDNDNDNDNDDDDGEEPDVNAITGKPYSPGPLSEELGNEATEVY
ncbi:hypothetical protein V5O48_010217 [Marasmius crinis-equi]|uniref:Uncharacterized protein n=1 Tax=Marasmius crinis-equi TaxID=585013 RepID=A0ABR3F9F6_9AGAR